MEAISDSRLWWNSSPRLQPGAGHMDFAAVFDAFAAVGYDDWLTFECRPRGEPEEALAASVRLLAGFLQD